MAAPFPSQTWADQFKQILNQSEAYKNAAHTWEGDFLLTIDGVGGLYLDLWHGVCREATYTTDLASVKATYTMTASMEAWRKVLAGQLEPVNGIMSRQLRLEGNLAKLLPHIKAAQEMVKCAAQVGIEE